MFKTHLAVSLFVLLLLLPKYGGWAFIVFFLLGTIMPDIDTSTSFIGKRFRAFGWLFLHRGIFHTIWMPLLLSLIIMFADREVAGAFALGYGLHLLLDSFNHAGIRPFHPLSKTRIKGIFKTGGVFEKILFISCLIASVVLIL